MFLFMVDIVLKTISYGKLYWKDYINVIDMGVVVLIFILIILDMGISDVSASMIFRL